MKARAVLAAAAISVLGCGGSTGTSTPAPTPDPSANAPMKSLNSCWIVILETRSGEACQVGNMVLRQNGTAVSGSYYWFDKWNYPGTELNVTGTYTAPNLTLHVGVNYYVPSSVIELAGTCDTDRCWLQWPDEIVPDVSRASYLTCSTPEKTLDEWLYMSPFSGNALPTPRSGFCPK